MNRHKVGTMLTDLGHLKKGQRVFILPSQITEYEFPVNVKGTNKDPGRWALEDEVTVTHNYKNR